jgi:predicted O-methyltransferase YrrM
MYSRLQIARKYLRYYFTAMNGKGHGVHSPFVYDLIRNVMNDRRRPAVWDRIESLRARLLKDKTWLEVKDMGAGSTAAKGRRRQVMEIASHAAKPARLGQLLSRIARYYGAECVVELGTSLGISTLYLASGTKEGARVWTIEGAAEIAAVAARNFQEIGQSNVELVVGNFDDRLKPLLERAERVDLAFVDGNHRREPTLRYFHMLMERCGYGAILIFDDIHWSAEMEQAWAEIQQDPRVYMTIDLFFIGLVVLREEFKIKQHFTIQY